MFAAIAGSTERTESAKIALPVAEVLRLPSPPRGKQTPWLSLFATCAGYLVSGVVLGGTECESYLISSFQSYAHIVFCRSEIGEARAQPGTTVDDGW